MRGMAKLSTYTSLTGVPALTDTLPITTGGLTKNVPVQNLIRKPYVTVGPSGSFSDYICDGVADDVELQSAASLISAAGGGVLLIRKGTYIITAQISIPSNCIVMGSGWATILKIGNSANINGIFNANTRNNVTFRDFEVDGNKANNTQYTESLIRAGSGDSIRIENVYGHDSTGQGLYLLESTNSVIINCISNDNGKTTTGMGFGLNNYSTTFENNNHIINCSASGNAEYGYSLYGNDTTPPHKLNSTISNCVADGNTNGGFSIYGTTTCAIHNCIATNNGGAGILVAGSCNNRVTDNYCANNTSYGIRLQNNAGVLDTVGMAANRNVISGNVIESHNLYGIYLTGSSYNDITSNQIMLSSQNGMLIQTNSNYNTISNNVSIRNGIRGIGIDNSNYNTVSSNIVNDNSQSSINAQAGIYLSNSSTHNVISSNQANDTQTGLTSLLTSNANSGQAIIFVADATIFYIGQLLTISDSGHSESVVVSSIDTGSKITLTANLTNSYTTAATASIIGRATQRYGIRENATSDDFNTIFGNVCKGNLTAQVSTSGVNSVTSVNITT
jgi:parallel beta-helix repeat protein